eukprot:SAG31_NODE_23221_length_508_cov_4.183374_1_plen_86_part_00
MSKHITNITHLADDILDMIANINREKYEAFCLMPLECELYGDSPFEGELWEREAFDDWALGLKVTKVHTAITFKQSKWLEIQNNT